MATAANLGAGDQEITAPAGTYAYIPPGTRHSFGCGYLIGRVETHWYLAASITASPPHAC